MAVTLTTGSSVPLTGATIPATSVDPAATTVVLQFDITNHLDGNNAALQAFLDVSLDGGVTWTRLCAVGRAKGQTAMTGTNTSIKHPLPGVGNANRMVRSSLLSSSSVTTSMQVILS